jgi:hypothetical protein
MKKERKNERKKDIQARRMQENTVIGVKMNTFRASSFMMTGGYSADIRVINSLIGGASVGGHIICCHLVLCV